MKVDRSKLKRSQEHSEVTNSSQCQILIEKLRECSMDQFGRELAALKTWNFSAKIDLCQWIDVLDKCDEILGKATEKESENTWSIACDKPENASMKPVVLEILRFLALLFDNTFSRHWFSSIDRLTALLDSSDVTVVVVNLHLLYVIAKKTQYLSKLNQDQRSAISSRLIGIAEKWGGKDDALTLADCCAQEKEDENTRPTKRLRQEILDKAEAVTSVYFQYYAEAGESTSDAPKSMEKSAGGKQTTQTAARSLQTIRVPQETLKGRSADSIMDSILTNSKVPIPKKERIALMSRLRLATAFGDRKHRLLCVMARCQATSILMYGQLLQESQINSIIYTGYIEELVEVLKLPDEDLSLDDVKTEILKTLTATVYLDRNPKLHIVVEATGANSYHGFVPSLMRRVIQSLRNSTKKTVESDGADIPGSSKNTETSIKEAVALTESTTAGVWSTQFSISLFSFIYHMAIYDGEPLVGSGMLESLLSVVNWTECPIDSITFVTRSVRVIDLIASLDSQMFQNLNGMNAIINRLVMEVGICRKEQGFQIPNPPPPAEVPPVEAQPGTPSQNVPETSTNERENTGGPASSEDASNPMEVESGESTSTASTAQAGSDSTGERPSTVDIERLSSTSSTGGTPGRVAELMSTDEWTPILTEPAKGVFCHPQRSALLKSLLNLVKRAIQDTQLAETTRHLMDGPFPSAIKHIVSNPDYYGSALFLNAINVVNQFIYQEPGQLTSLQDKGLTHVIMQALLIRDVPPSREVLAALPSTFAALCLNERGLQAFMACEPFEKLFKVLLSTKYLPAMKRRRTSDALGDTAMNLGAAVDELMRHQPALKPGAMQAVVKLLKSLCEYGTDPKYECVAKLGSKAPGAAHVAEVGAAVVAPDEVAAAAGVDGAGISHQASSNDSSDEEEDEDEDSDSRLPVEAVESDSPAEPAMETGEIAVVGEPSSASDQGTKSSSEKRIQVPLMDYIGNVMKFIEAILSNNATDDHARLFVQSGGVAPLAQLVALPNLSAEFGSSSAFNSVASAVRYIVTQARDASVMELLLKQLKTDVLPGLKPLLEPLDPPGGSSLLKDTLKAAEGLDSEGATASLCHGQLMRGLGMLHSHLMVLGHVAKIGQSVQQNELKSLLLSKWTSDLGREVLLGLQEVHRALVWESSVMLTLGDQQSSAAVTESGFAREQLKALTERGKRRKSEQNSKKKQDSSVLSTVEPMDTDVVANKTITEESETANASDPSTSKLSGNDNASKEPSSERERERLAAQETDQTAKNLVQELKPVVSAASKVGRQLSDLLAVLVKSSLGGTSRGRRGQNPFILPPSPQGVQLTEAMCDGFRETFLWNPAGDKAPKKLRMTYLICVIAIVGPLLLDERKQAYHLVLQKFFASGCQKAYFDCLNSVIGNELNSDTDIPAGMEEFLESWLTLLEKLVNSQNILDSQNKLLDTTPPGGAVPRQNEDGSLKASPDFSPIQYLVATQKSAFDNVQIIWRVLEKLKCKKSIELTLSVLCHILRGQKQIEKEITKTKEKYKKTDEERRRQLEEDIDPLLLQSLVDMGFSRNVAMDALLMTNTLEGATEWLLSHPNGRQLPGQPGLNVLMDEDEQLAQAIAMSLAQETEATPDANGAATEGTQATENPPPAPTESNNPTEEPSGNTPVTQPTEGEPIPSTDTPMETDSGANVATDGVSGDGLSLNAASSTEESDTGAVADVSGNLSETDPPVRLSAGMDSKATKPPAAEADSFFSWAILHFTGREILPRCLSMIDDNPELVYRCVDLMSVAVKVMGPEWTRKTLLKECLIGEARELGRQLIKLCDQEENDWLESTHSISLNTRLHLLCLLLTELKDTCCLVAQNCDFNSVLVELLSKTAEKVRQSEHQKLPKFMSPLLLYLDLYEKIAVASKRRRQIKNSGTKFTWRYWDNRQWIAFHPSTIQQLREAYDRGDQTVRFTVQRRRYTVDFGSMNQMNMDSGFTRPILMVPEEEKPQTQDGKKEEKEKEEESSGAEIGSETAIQREKESTSTAGSKQPEKEDTKIELESELRSFSVEQSSKIVRACVELMSASMEGLMLHAVLRLCLRLTRHSGVAEDFMNLGGLKKILDLKQAQSFSGMQTIVPLLVRHVLEDDATLRHTMEKVVRAVAQGAQHVSGQYFGQEDPSHRQPPEFHFAMRSLGPVAARRPDIFVDVFNRVVRLKLEPLRADEADREGPPIGTPMELKVEGGAVQTPLKMSNALEQVLALLLNYLGMEWGEKETLIGGEEMESRDGQSALDSDKPDDPSAKAGKSTKAAEKGDKCNSADQPLVPKSSVLRMLAELIRSYTPVAGYVAQYRYKQEGHEELSAMSYVLDNLLQPTMKVDSELLSAVRTLVGTLAAANHCPEAQTALVLEVKSALLRAVALPESQEKHQKIIALVSIISLMRESCPNVPVQGQPPGTKVSALSTNSILQKVVRRKVISDLSRIPLSLDLSSPHTVGTVNAVLKVLEELTRLINSPCNTSVPVNAPTRVPPPAQGATNAEIQQNHTGDVVTDQALRGESNSTEENRTNERREEGTERTATDDGGTRGPRDPIQELREGENGEIRQNSDTPNQAAADSMDSSSLSDIPPTSDNTPANAERQAVAARVDELNAVRDSDHPSIDHPAITRHRIVLDQEDSTSSEDDDGDSHDEDDEDSASDPDEDDLDGQAMNGGDEGGNDNGSEHSDYELGDDAEDEVTAELDVDMDEDDEDDDSEIMDSAAIRAEFTQMNVEEEMMDVIAQLDRAAADYPLGLQDALNSIGGGGHRTASGIRLVVPGGRQNEEFNMGISLFGARMPEMEASVTAGVGTSAGSSQQLGLNHPLLIRHADSANIVGSSSTAGGATAQSRWFPLGGSRDFDGSRWGVGPGAARHHGGLHRQGAVRHQRNIRLLMHSTTNNNDAGILRRLFGPDADELLNLTRGTGQDRGATRFVITDNDLRNSALIEDYDESTSASRPTVSSVPSVFSRWTEESIILDGDSVHFLVAALKPEIESELKRHRQTEWEERREKLAEERKQAEKEKPPHLESEVKTDTAGSAVPEENSSLSSAEGSHESLVDSSIEPGNFYQRAFMTALINNSRPMEGRAGRGWNPPRRELANAASAVADELVSSSLSSATETLAANGAEMASASVTVTTTESLTATDTMTTSTEITVDGTSEATTESGAVPERMQIEQDPFSNITSASSVTVNSSDGEGPLEHGEPGENAPQDNGESSVSGTTTETEATQGQTSEAAVEERSNATNEIEVESSEDARQRRQAEIETYRHLLGDIDIPEGVDVSFLAALPAGMRQEVIEDHLRQQRVRRLREAPAAASGAESSTPATAAPTPSQGQAAEGAVATQNGTADAASTAAAILDAEFLDALPPEIQEEVLNQQRMAQAAANPPAHVEAMDPATFMETLPPSLRRQILADADDSQLQNLPAHILREAQTLRAQLEQRTLQQQARAFPYVDIFGGGSRHAAYQYRQAQQRAGQAGGGGFGSWRHAGAGTGGGFGTFAGSVAAAQSVRGQQLLDREALSGLLVLFFMDDQRLNIGRLHRILKSLCFHAPTRDWLVRALISILEQVDKSLACQIGKAEESKKTSNFALSSTAVRVDGVDFDSKQPTQSWLNLTVDTGLGNRANVFEIERKQTAGKKVSSVLGAPGPKETLLIHKLVASPVCRHVLDSLISLAKSFPGQFVPNSLRSSNQQTADQSTNESGANKEKDKVQHATDGAVTDFWQILLRLDSGTIQGSGPNPSIPGGLTPSAPGRPGSVRSRAGSRSSTGQQLSVALSEEVNYSTFDEAPLGRMMSMLNHPVIGESTTLLDRLLRLLSSVVMALPDNSPAQIKEKEARKQEKSVTPFTLPESVLDEQLRLAVEVVTRGKCSEDGLQDGRNLLLESVRAFGKGSRHSVIKLLLGSAQKLGEELGTEIGTFLTELAALPQPSASEDSVTGKGELGLQKGLVQDRFEGSTVVISGKNLAKANPALSSCPELQLNGVTKLTDKGSTQNYLLRTLNTVIQVREAVKARDRAIKEQLKREREEKEKKEKQEKERKEKEEKEKRETEQQQANKPASGVAGVEQEAQIQNGAPSETPQDATVAGADIPVSVGNEPMDWTGNPSPTEAPQPSAETIEEKPKDASSSASASGKLISSGSPEEEEAEEEKSPLENSQLSQLLHLDGLWERLSGCLKRLGGASDPHAVLILQPAAETFFLVHATEKPEKASPPASEAQTVPLAPQDSQESQDLPGGAVRMNHPSSPAIHDDITVGLSGPEMSSYNMVELTGDTQKLVMFAEDHRRVLNQILRQSNVPLSEGPFSVLIDYPKLLDFDVKRKYFKKELSKLDDRARFSRRDDVPLRVRRNQVFQESFRELFRLRPAEWKNRFFVIFEGEEGQDAGGLLREWFTVITREIFNPNYALFKTSPGDRVTYMINEASYINVEHLDYFKFVGHFIAKAVYDGKLLECYFTRAFYKHILNKPVKYQDLESEDPTFFTSLEFVKEHPVEMLGMDLNFSVEVQEFGVTEVRDLKPDGRNIPVTDETKEEYIRLVCQMKMTSAIRKQLQAFLEGFYDIIPKKLIVIFNEQELELLISGLPNVDVEDLQANTDYHKYTKNSLQIQWFWRALRSFEQEDRAKFLQFLTGTSKVPLQGFAHLEGMNGTQKFSIHRDDRSTNRLPTAHTCFNQLDLPVYESYDKLRQMLIIAIHEGSEGFGFA